MKLVTGPNDLDSDNQAEGSRSSGRPRIAVRVLTWGWSLALAALAVGFGNLPGPPTTAPSRRFALIGTEGLISALAFKADGGLVVATTDCRTRLWEIGAGDSRARPVDEALSGNRSVWPPGSSVLILGGDCTVTLRASAVGAPRVQILTRKGESRALLLGGDGGTLLEQGAQPDADLAADIDHDLVSRGVTRVAFAPDGRSLAMGDTSGYVRVWDLVEARQRAEVRAHPGAITSLAYSCDSRRLATASQGDFVARLWDADRCLPLASLRGHTSPVQALAFAPDGRTLATTGMDHTVRLWEADTGGERPFSLLSEESACALAFSPDGRTLAAGGVGRAVWLWDVGGRTGDPPAKASW